MPQTVNTSNPSQRHLDGRVALVTGSASGIGAAVARQMANEGASLVVADLNTEGMGTVVDQIKTGGGEAIGVETDVADPDSFEAAVATALQTFGRIDILHNNAAALSSEILAQDQDVANMDLAVWEKVLSVNLTGAAIGCRVVIPIMLKNGGGVIVNTSSVAGIYAERLRVAYGVSKAGLILLTKHVAVTYGTRGIRCNALALGVVVTARSRALRDQAWFDRMEQLQSMKGLGTPEDIANIVAFLASDRARFINGEVIKVDGAMTALLRGEADFLRDKPSS